MADIFTEVDEDLRQERALDLLKRMWPWIAGALLFALVVALGWWGWSSWTRGQEAKASAAYGKALDALAANKLDEADKGFAEAGKVGSSGYKALSLMQQAGIRLIRNKPADAVTLLDQAAKSTRSPLIADAAALEAAMATLDTAPLAQTQTRLQPLTAVGRPYRDSAREALAFAKLAAGRAADARSDLAALSLQPDVSDGARARARAAMALIDSGGAAVLPAAVKADLALPPPPPAAPAAALAAGPGAQ